SSAKRSSGGGSSASRSSGRSSGGGGGGSGSSSKGIVKRAASGIRDAGSKAVDTAKQHPVATTVIGAGVATGVALLAAHAIRNGGSSSAGDTGDQSDQGSQATDERAQDMESDAGDQGAAYD